VRRGIEFQTFPTDTPVSPGAYIYVDVGLNTWDRMTAGVVMLGGVLNAPLSDRLRNGTYAALVYRSGGNVRSLASVTVADGKANALSDDAGSMFVLGAVTDRRRVFRVTEVTMSEEGEVTVKALEHPCETVDGNLLSRVANFSDEIFAVDEMGNAVIVAPPLPPEPPGPEPEELVIWYPDEPPPLSTNALVTIVEEDTGGDYNTIVYEGTNSLQSASNELYDTVFTLSNAELLGDDQSFTVDFFARLGTSLSGDSFRFSYVGFIFSTSFDGGVTYSAALDVSLLFYVGGVIETGGPEQILQVYDYNIENPTEAYIELTPTQVTTVKHVAIQYIAGSKTVVHYDGVKVFDENVQPDGLYRVYAFIGNNNLPNQLLSQIRLTAGARYGDLETISVPSYPFFTPPS
jgi:hypothetical protein